VLGGEFSTGPPLTREPASDGNARSLTPAIGDRYSSHPERSKVCERDRGGEVSRALPLPFREDNPEKSSVRSMTSSVGVAAAGDVDLEDPTLGLVRGTFSSSSEEMTCVVGDRVLRRPSIDTRPRTHKYTLVRRTSRTRRTTPSGESDRLGMRRSIHLRIVHRFQLPHSDHGAVAVCNTVNLSG
jgi:hypothetical protein